MILNIRSLKAIQTFFMGPSSQSADLSPTDHVFQLLEDRMKEKRPRKRQELQMAAVQAKQSVTGEDTKCLLRSIDCRSRCLQIIHIQILNVMTVAKLCELVQILSVPLSSISTDKVHLT